MVLDKNEITKEYLIRECITNKKRPREIAEENNIKIIKVYKLLNHFNIKVGHVGQNKKKIDIEKLVDLYVNQKINIKKLAEIFGVTRLLITERLTSLGIEIRQFTEYYTDLTGKKIGKLTVLEVVDDSARKGKGRKWKCLCECGKYVDAYSNYLTAKRGRKSCGCLAKGRIGKNNKLFKGYGEIGLGLFKRIYNSAIVRNLEFEITIEDMWNLFLEQDRKCALSGIPLYFRGKKNKNASLDRIDSSIGYVKDNIQWVHKDINKMKLDHSEEYFIYLCTSIANHIRNKNEEKIPQHETEQQHHRVRL